MFDPVQEELLRLNQRLLDSIAQGDWATYQDLCDPSLSAFEPEALGHLVEGLEFHRFYFQLGGVKGPYHTTMSAPRVRVLGDVAVLAYVRLNQRLDGSGNPVVVGTEETRIWQRQDGKWKHVHFHRSALPAT
jgi:calcium/calmodulin-dependent protein kinase (CaM kinase) II